MNKLFKIIIALMGGVNVMFSIFVPIGLTLLLLVIFDLSQQTQTTLLLIGLISTLYRAIDVGLLKGGE